MRKPLLALTALAFAAASSAACATKGYVNQQISQVSGQVDSLSQSLEETQQATRDNAGRIVEVDGKADAAQSSADQAGSAAMAADGKATEAGNAARSAGDAARAAGDHASALEDDMNRILYEVILSEDQGNFRFGDATLPDGAKEAIDEMIGELLANPQGAYFEIEGHTDNTGPEEVNERLGLERAETVKRYLYEEHSIPLHKMNVISFGETKPMAPNNTREGRAQNRRVVIRVIG
jgi:peptidoglycan-associated lipoprotein